VQSPDGHSRRRAVDDEQLTIKFAAKSNGRDTMVATLDNTVVCLSSLPVDIVQAIVDRESLHALVAVRLSSTPRYRHRRAR
jgi:hypothetical protein